MAIRWSKVNAWIDVDCREDVFADLARWWLLRLPTVAELLGEDQSGSGPRWSWATAVPGAPVEGSDDDPRAMDRILAGVLDGPGSFALGARVQSQPDQGALLSWSLSHLAGDPESTTGFFEVKFGGDEAPTRRRRAESPVVALVEEFAAAWTPLFAGVSDDFDEVSVPLDKAQNLNQHVARQQAREFLRSY